MKRIARRSAVGAGMVLGLVAALLPLGGCRLGGSVSTETALNQLRAENAELKGKVAKAEGEAAELRTKLQTGASALMSLPVCTRIEIGSLSGWSKDGEHLDLLVQTLDGRNRFVPVAATIRVTSEGSPFASLQFGPEEVREMYRSGLLGTYYLVTVPRSQVGDVVRVDLVDEVTGKSHVAAWMRESKVAK